MGNRRLVVIIASFFTVLIGFTIRNSYGVLLPEMLPSLNISKKEAGMIYGSFFMAYTVFSPVLGLLADRINLRILLTLFLGILGMGTFLMGYSSSLMEAMFFFLLAGIGSSACWSPIVPLVQRWTGDRRRGTILALVDTGSSTGIAFSSILMPFMVGAFNWRMGWKSLGVMAFFMASMSFFLVKDSPAEKPDLPKPQFNPPLNKPTGTLYLKILKDKKFLLIGISYFLIGFSTLIPLTFITTYAVQELKVHYNAAAWLITVIAAASIIGKIGLSTLSDKLGRIKTIILCETLVVVGCFGMACLPKFWALHLSMVIFGLGFGALWPLYALCAPDYFSKSVAGFMVGFWTLFLGMGFVISPIVAGWIADGTGQLMWSFVLAMVTAMVSIFLLVLVRRKISLGKGENSQDLPF